MANYDMNSVGETPVSSSDVEVVAAHGSLTVATALSGSDTITGPSIPKNAKLVDLILSTEDLDNNGTPTITLTATVEDGTTTHTAFTADTVGQAGGVKRCDSAEFIGKVLDSDDFVAKITVATGPATGATSVDVHLVVLYTMKLNNGERNE